MWLPELSGMLNMVLDAGPSLIANDGFIEPKSSFKAREKFEGGGNQLKKYVYENYDVNNIGDKIKWYTRPLDFQTHYKIYCEENSEEQLSLGRMNKCLEGIPGIERATKNVDILNPKPGEKKWTSARVWAGLRLKGTSGEIAKVKKSDDF